VIQYVSTLSVPKEQRTAASPAASSPNEVQANPVQRKDSKYA